MKKNIRLWSTLSIAVALAGGVVAFNSEQTGKASKALINASKKGIKDNTYSGAGDDNTLVNVTKLTNSQKVELSEYTLSLINSARNQLGKQSWTYKTGALHFADRVADQYYNHDKSCWDADHYVPGIERAAKASGLN